jgi:hypothetical protein
MILATHHLLDKYPHFSARTSNLVLRKPGPCAPTSPNTP